MLDDENYYDSLVVLHKFNNNEYEAKMLSQLIQTLERMKVCSPEQYESIIFRFTHWFSKDKLEFPNFSKLSESEQRLYCQVDWPSGPNDWECLAKLIDYSVFYYRENGEQHEIKIAE